MRSNSQEGLRVLLLSEEYDLSRFCSTNAELNDFLKNDVLTSQDVLGPGRAAIGRNVPDRLV